MSWKRSLGWFVALAAVGACQKAPPEPEPEPTAQAEPAATTPAQTRTAATATATATATAKPIDTSAGALAVGTASTSSADQSKPAAPPVATVPVSPDDPLHGQFTLADATKGLPGKGPLQATIKTSLGTLKCELYDDRAPITVANFVGLARGRRPWKTPDGKWVKKPAYNGTTFHRVIKGFMIQGGDPAGNGTGEPGYVIPDEVWAGAHHDERGLICMANRGPNTNGQQFFIMDGAAPHLDKSYTIFGKCGPDDVIEKIASVDVHGDRAVDPPKIKKVTIGRAPAKKTAH